MPGALNLAACLHHRQSPASWKGQEKEEDFALGGKGKKGMGSGHGIRREETGRRGGFGALARGWDAECIRGGWGVGGVLPTWVGSRERLEFE